MSDYQHTHYPETSFGGFTKVDGTVAFFARVNALLRPEFNVLDVGCGKGSYSNDPVSFRRELRILKGKCKRIIGIDLDPEAESNPCLDEFRLIESASWPIESSSVDLCVSDHVLEHVVDTAKYFSELARVTKAGGIVCIRTPNSNSYVALASRLIPNRHHAKLLARVQTGRAAHDVFPTAYRCNTVSRIQRALSACGFQNNYAYLHESEPSYLQFSSLAYRLGVWHQRLSPDFMKPVVFAFGQRSKK